MGLGSLARGDFAAAKEYGAADELGITVGLMPAPPSPFMPPDQFGKPVVALILAWTGDPAEANKS
jgi:hypothetical protein